MKDKCKFTGSSGHILIPLDVRNDERLSDAAKLLYGDIQRLIDRKDGSANISLKALSEVTRKKERMVKYLLNQLFSSGYLRKSKTAFGAANTYELVDLREGIRRDIIEFLEVFSNIFSSLKMQSLLYKYKDEKKLLYTLEALEWQYRKANRPVDNPAGLLHKAMTKRFTPEDDFIPGWWKAKIAEDRAAKEREKLRKEKELLQRQEIAKLEEWYESLSESERKKRIEAAVEALRKNGGVPKYGAEIAIRHKMYELYQGGKK